VRGRSHQPQTQEKERKRKEKNEMTFQVLPKWTVTHIGNTVVSLGVVFSSIKVQD
jgi:hypothetical protein